MLDFLQSSSFRQLLLALCGVALPALNAKLGMNISDAQIEAVLASITSIVVASKLANAHVAGKAAAATVTDVAAAKEVLAEQPPVVP